jgi:NitT/TauT family transport system substrate-binding protein
MAFGEPAQLINLMATYVLMPILLLRKTKFSNKVAIMERRQVIALGVSVLIIGSLGALVLWSAQPTPDVRIGYLTKDLHQLALRVAIVNGLFEREGIDVQLLSYGNGGLEMDGFLSNQIDMGYLGAAPALLKRLNNDILITILAAVNLEGSAIMVSKTEYDLGHVTNITDLAGKGVFHPGPPTVQNFLLRLALNQSGMSYTDINPQTALPSSMADALSAANPAFIVWEPFCARAQYEEKAVPLLLSGDIWPNHPCCVVASRNAFMQANPDTVQKVVEIHKEAEEWILNHPAEAIAIAVDWLEMDESAVETAFNRIIYDYNVNVTGLETYLNFLIDEGQIEPGHAPTNITAFFESFVNTTIIDSA